MVRRIRGWKPGLTPTQLVPRGRWLPFFIGVDGDGEPVPVYIVGGQGEGLGLTLKRSEAWFLDRLPCDREAALLAAKFRSRGLEVFALGDEAREEVFEFRDYGFRLVEDDMEVPQ